MRFTIEEHTVGVATGRAMLEATLNMPRNAAGLILFAHGSGSSRHSPRNRFVAEVLQHAGLGTLLLDLLTTDEERIDLRTREKRFDIDLLADRLVGALWWIDTEDELRGLAAGLFGASTGAAAALVAAARRPERVGAVVSRGGRPDLAGEALPDVQAPTLLIVGDADEPVIDLNQRAMDHMVAQTKLEIVFGASHLFEEPGTLERVAELARDWFVEHLVSPSEAERASAIPPSHQEH